ncbi:MAG TPA: hypothetical protein VIZ68_01570 [Thermoplasmata archaeon]
MDVDSVLLSVQERDKWRHRLDLLQTSLRELRSNRELLEVSVRRIKRDLTRLARYSEAVLDQTIRSPAARTVHASEGHTPHR